MRCGRLPVRLMRLMPCVLLAVALVVGGVSSARAVAAGELAARTVVVYNRTDPESEGLARFYAGRRGIAAERLVGLDCAREEEITREAFDRTIAEPLRAEFVRRGWWRPEDPGRLGRGLAWSDISFLALMRGVPLRIGAVEGYPGDEAEGAEAVRHRNEASVDSELVLLARENRRISGIVDNPCFNSFTAAGAGAWTDLLLVGRLDGPSAEIVRRMITDSIAAERSGLRGWLYVDARGLREGPYLEGDQWLDHLARHGRRNGLPVVIDRRDACFPEGYPMRRAAAYFGWYADHVSGPMAQGRNCFVPGAVAVHLHSFSAATLRDPARHWCGPLLAAGAAATAGSVYEPYLTMTPHLDVFWERLRAGYTFAESGWMSERALSWMTTFVGDPLYRPFPEHPTKPLQDEWAAYAEGARLWQGDSAAGAAFLREGARKKGSGMMLEALGLLQKQAGESEAALESWGRARPLYSDAMDRWRVLGSELELLRESGRSEEARALAAREKAPVDGPVAQWLGTGAEAVDGQPASR